MVAQAGTLDRHLLLVLRASICPGIADRPAGAGRRRRLQYPRRRRVDRILRQWTWSVVAASALGPGRAVPRRIGLHALLAASHVPRRRLLEISCDPSFF